MKQLIRGYVAGVVDGEGYIGISKDGAAPCLVVTSTTENLPRALAAMTRIGYAKLCKRRRDRRRVQAWQWLCFGKAAIKIVRQIYDLLIVKKAQADWLLKFADYLDARSSPAARKSKADTAFGRNCGKEIRKLNSRQMNKLLREQAERGEFDLWESL